jgi:CRP/FNR family cyclic AMP-dependent transcriptional regulator
MAAQAPGGLEPWIAWRQRRVAVKPRHQVTLSTDDEMPGRRFCEELSMQVPKKTNGTREARKAGAATTVPRFNAQAFLTSAGAGRSTANYQAKKTVFRQGDPADAVFYIQRGKINLTVVSDHGKEGVIAMLGAGDFFGEGCLAGQPLHMASAVAMVDSTIARIEMDTMIRVLHEEPKLSERFMAYLLSRNIQFEAELVDQLFNSSERRLARILLLLANFGKEGKMETVIPKISQEVLAARVGTTRSRINFFMNKFRKLGFIEYNGGLKVHTALLNIVVHD